MRARLFVPVALLGAVALAQTPNATGKWVGQLTPPKVDMSKMKPEQKKQVEASLAMMKSFKVNLNLKSDKTFAIATAATKGPNGMQIPANNIVGKWTQKGTLITLKIEKQNGQPLAAKDMDKGVQNMTISSDGKKISMSPTGAGAPPFTIVYKRA